MLPPHHTHCYQFVIANTGQFEKVIFIILFTKLPIASSCECLSYTVCDRKKKSHVVFPNGYFVVRPNTLTFLDHRIKITWWIKTGLQRTRPRPPRRLSRMRHHPSVMLECDALVSHPPQDARARVMTRAERPPFILPARDKAADRIGARRCVLATR